MNLKIREHPHNVKLPDDLSIETGPSIICNVRLTELVQSRVPRRWNGNCFQAKNWCELFYLATLIACDRVSKPRSCKIWGHKCWRISHNFLLPILVRGAHCHFHSDLQLELFPNWQFFEDFFDKERCLILLVIYPAYVLPCGKIGRFHYHQYPSPGWN